MRMQPFLVWFIEGASYLGEAERDGLREEEKEKEKEKNKRERERKREKREKKIERMYVVLF